MKKKEVKSLSLKKAIDYIWKTSKMYVLIRLVSATLLGVFPVFIAYFTREMIECITSQIDKNGALTYLGLILLFTIFCGIINFINNRYIPLLNSNIEIQLNKDIIYKTSRVPLSFFDDSKSYDKVEEASREIKTFLTLVDCLFTIISSIISLICIIPIIIELDLLLIFIIIVFNIPIAYIQLVIKKNNYETSREITHINRCISGTRNMLVNKYYAPEVRMYSLFEWLFGKFKHYYCSMVNLQLKKTSKQSSLTLFNEIILALLAFFTQFILVFRTCEGSVSIANFATFGIYMSKFNSSIYSIIISITMLREREMFLYNIFEFLEKTEEIKYIKTLSKLNLNEKIDIEFKNVSFHYPNDKRMVLSNVSFVLKSGETLAIVGLNGAGKTTLIKLLLRFYEITSGQILINGEDINSYPIDEYYEKISVVFQSSMLYPFTIRENIKLNDLELKKEEYEKFYWLKTFIEKQPLGYETIVLPYFDKSGIEPSEGERQRIAFARAISKKNYNLLILDEPSSSMDAEVEYELFNDIKSVCGDKTAIIISHRLATVVMADKIIVLKNGRIIESGTHLELMKTEGEYNRLFKLQSERYVGENDGK